MARFFKETLYLGKVHIAHITFNSLPSVERIIKTNQVINSIGIIEFRIFTILNLPKFEAHLEVIVNSLVSWRVSDPEKNTLVK